MKGMTKQWRVMCDVGLQDGRDDGCCVCCENVPSERGQSETRERLNRLSAFPSARREGKPEREQSREHRGCRV